MIASLRKRALCEALGTGLLTAAVIGSGIMAERLALGNTAIALLANTVATGAALFSLIVTFASLSGAHLNPVVSLSMVTSGAMKVPEAAAYIAAQSLGALSGTFVAHAMFAVPIFSLSHHPRAGWPQFLSEFVATFGLLLVIRRCSQTKSGLAAPAAIAAYIVAAYWFTSSTSFANPALTIARSISDTFAGIRPIDVPGFIAAQILGAFAATIFSTRILPASANA